jgi:hypothetical protein
MKIITSKFKKVADFCYELFRIAKIPLHFSRFSNKIYSNFQKLFLLVYKQFRKFTYEELLTDLADNLGLRVYLGLVRLPHYTTFIHFAKKLPCSILDKLVIAFKKLVPRPKRVAIDATGISLDNASPHYCKRIGLTHKKRPFMKTSFIVDIDNFIILLCKMRKKTRHDTIDAKHLIKKLAKHYEPEILYADRGYDANSLFELCFEKLKAYPLILQKRLDVPKHRRKGTYRKMTYDVFDYGEYLQRNRIETCNSMIKKRFASNVRSKLDKLQRVDVTLRIVAYNIDRLLRLGMDIILIFIKIIRVSY